jgi:creatinine amidohydrolase
MLWAERTWSELGGDIAAASAAAILPVGATEQHGPHLGTGMDTVLADKLCRDVATRTGVPMLPPLPYGCSLGHSKRWPGTIALQPTTLIEVVQEIGTWAYHSGVRRLFIVNTHVTNAAPLRCALEMLRATHDDLMVTVINTAMMTERVAKKSSDDAADWHANAAETSLMLAIAPEITRPDLFAAADDPDRTEGKVFAHPVNRTSLNGVTGFPSRATLAEGQLLFEWMVKDLCEMVERGKRETPPLDQSYNSRAEGL